LLFVIPSFFLEFRTSKTRRVMTKHKRKREVEPSIISGADPAAASPSAAAAAAAAAAATDPADPAAAAAPRPGTPGDPGHGAADPKPAGRSAPVLPWMRVPVAIDPSDGVPLEAVGGLDPRLARALRATGVDALFPVQSAVWRQTAGGASPLHDVCIAAPTGSGKTLAYLLPVISALAARRAPRRLRALVVLPTRDLALQVHAVLRALCPAVGLAAAAACGSAALAAEAAALRAGAADILVATPGRLMAHLGGTPGFTLGHLRFLVVDEADRLLRQGYQNWLPRVAAATAASAGAAAGRVIKLVVSATLTRDPSKVDRLGLRCPRYVAVTAPGERARRCAARRAGLLRPRAARPHARRPRRPPRPEIRPAIDSRSLLGGLPPNTAAADDHRYKLPPGLRETKLVVAAEHKPAALAAVLAACRGQPTVVFTASVEATHRLALALRAMPALVGGAVEYSAAVAPAARRAALEAFRAGAASVLVCSDAMTRGMDVEGVAVVVNYDAPVYVKTYVHRAGRTARAGRGGRVVTLLRKEDVRHFKGMLRKADNAYVGDEQLGADALAGVRPQVEQALAEMAAALEEEEKARRAAVAGGGGAAAAAAAAKPAPPAKADGAAQRKDGGRAPKRRKLHGVPELRL
jgi:ATP-dependent RNA helicase DDX51/DBP6